MDHTDIISVDQVSMRFALASEKVDSLKEYFIKTLKSQISTNEVLGTEGCLFQYPARRCTGTDWFEWKRKSYDAEELLLVC